MPRWAIILLLLDDKTLRCFGFRLANVRRCPYNVATPQSSVISRQGHKTWLPGEIATDFNNLLSDPNDRFRPARVESSSLQMAVSARKIAFFDGGEMSLFSSVEEQGSKSYANWKRTTVAGIMTIVTGTTTDEGRSVRIVGVQIPNGGRTVEDLNQAATLSLDNNMYLYPDSVARIPDNVSDEDAISTLVASIGGLHCALPRVDDVGGDVRGNGFVSGKAVILGGGEYAVFAARGMAALGADVTIVSTGKPRINEVSVKTMTPAVKPDNVGFASVLGEFDSLLDTVNDEGGAGMNVEGDDDDEEMEADLRFYLGSGVIEQLKIKNKCKKYCSTYSRSQQIVRDAGAIFGPGKAKEYEGEIHKMAVSSPERFQQLLPPIGFGPDTLQSLFDSGVIYPAGQNKGKDVILRGWSIKDFWELASWPRDASGNNVRFGLPVNERMDDFLWIDDEEDEDEDFVDASVKQSEERSNPFVVNVRGVQGLASNVLDAKRDCLLFLSSPSCRTCRYITPQYNRMARLAAEQGEEASLMYAKADAIGRNGKELGRVLEVEAVPTFVMFRKGERYGSALAVSKLPSQKLDKAVTYLTSGLEWDGKEFQDEKFS